MDIRPVKEAERDRGFTIIIIIIVIIAVILVVFAIYLLFTRRRDADNGAGGGVACTTSLDCEIDQSCVGGFCRDIGCSLPGAPTGLSAEQTDNNEVTVEWDASPEALSYRLYIGLTVDFTKQQAIDIIPVPLTSKVLELSNGTTWYFFVTAVNDCGESHPSSIASEMPTFIWPSDVFSIVKIPVPGGVEGGIGRDTILPIDPDLIILNQCLETETPSECSYVYSPTDHKIKLSDDEGNTTGQCIGVFTGTIPPGPGSNIRAVSCTTTNQIQLDKIQWRYNDVDNSLCLLSNNNLCLELTNPSLGTIETSISDGSLEQKWILKPSGEE